MAPSALAMRSTATSGDSLFARAGSSGRAANSMLLAARQDSSSQASWSAAHQTQLAGVVDNEGMFNGTCTSDRGGLPPTVANGQCASYYPNVTLYCCAAVGGSAVDSVQQGGDPNRDGTTDANATVVEPACITSTYDTMLTCYMYTAEEHCRSAISGPWGICNPGDDSQSGSSTEGGDKTSSSSMSQQTGADSLGVTISAGGPSARTSLRNGRPWLYTWASALFLFSALLFLIDETSG